MVFSNFPPPKPVIQLTHQTLENVIRHAIPSQLIASDSSIMALQLSSEGGVHSFAEPKTILAVPNLAEQASTQTQGRSPDTREFLNGEEAIRAEYVENHPFSLSYFFPPQAAKRLNENNFTTKMRFSMEVTEAVLGRLKAKEKAYKKPSFWQQRAAEMIMSLPHSDALTLSILGLKGVGQTDVGAIDNLAKQNLQNFKRIIEIYGATSAVVTFDTDTPARQAQSFLSAFKTFVHEDVQFPNVYTVWVEDLDDSNDEDRPDGPSYSHVVLNQLAGHGNPDDSFFESYSREHKTEVLHRAFLHFVDVAEKVSHETNNDGMSEYAKLLSLNLVTNGSTLALKDSSGLGWTDRDSILAVFGKEALEKFDNEPDQAKKSATARAALIMQSCEMHAVFPMLVTVE